MRPVGVATLYRTGEVHVLLQSNACRMLRPETMLFSAHEHLTNQPAHPREHGVSGQLENMRVELHVEVKELRIVAAFTRRPQASR